MDWSDLVSSLASEGIRRILDLLEQRNLTSTQSKAEISLRLPQHLAHTAAWATEVQFFGMSEPERTEEDTIPLRLASSPRRFRGHTGPSLEYPETDLLRPGTHHLLLGDPGSGKTTTLKRLTLHLLTREGHSEDPWSYPLVLRFRDIDPRLNIYEALAQQLGIRYDHQILKTHSTPPPPPQRPTKHNEKISDRLRRRIDHDIRRREVDEATVAVVGDQYLRDVISTLLNETQAILILDGLDELPLSSRERFESSLQELSLALDSSKVLISCRSGDYSRNLQGFSVVELCPLDYAQTRNLASKWIADPGAFLEALEQNPFSDLANRPLLLCQLMVYYKNVGYLPDRAASVYQTVIRLLLEDWDRRRGIRRGSRYADFQPDDKLEFLASVAYGLTYRIRTKRFDRADMRAVYLEIHPHFGLPESEMDEVVAELETHTGILVESGPQHYEFSHLSLQEYLCAHHLVREPFSDRLEEYFLDYPAPLAVAVSLAANPSMWFAALILRRSRGRGPSVAAVRSFLTRLQQENPRFAVSAYLGFAVIELIAQTDIEAEGAVMNFLDGRHVAESVALALGFYEIEDEYTDPMFRRLKIRADLVQSWELPPRKVAKIPRVLFERISERLNVASEPN